MRMHAEAMIRLAPVRPHEKRDRDRRSADDRQDANDRAG
jgi:hypothetical protein